MQTNLSGRLRNTSLPVSHGLLPLFEAVVNSLHSLEEVAADSHSSGTIRVEIVRSNQGSLALPERNEALADIVGFKITDNGVGFNDVNIKSFKTLDTDHKVDKGCRGVGRLLWLKAFKTVKIESVYATETGLSGRKFTFDANLGVKEPVEFQDNCTQRATTVELQGFLDKYRAAAPKSILPIAKSLLEHCLWYFVREGGSPSIIVCDGSEEINLDDLYEQYMHTAAFSESIKIADKDFILTHIKFRASSSKNHTLSFCAANRLVKEEALTGKIAGLYGNLHDGEGDFVYSCYVSSPYLDERVRSERTGFDIEESVEGLFENQDISLKKIREALIQNIKTYLGDVLLENIKAGKNRIEKFVSEKAPRYRPILNRIPEDDLIVDSNISDKDLDLMLHKKLAEFERSILESGHSILIPAQGESIENYYQRVQQYLSDVSDMKKSDLADYVAHRRVIIDLLDGALKKNGDGKYVTEDIIHQLIMPMRKDSNEVSPDGCNLWLLDERLAFHDYLASDKSIKSMPITGSDETKEPDLISMSVYDNPLLVSEQETPPLGSIVVVEIKRPMRNDAQAGEDKDPIEQSLGYLQKVRDGKATTASGRPIPDSSEIPGYCYIVCDITDSIKRRCNLFGLTVSSDKMGYFGYNPNYKAYIEVISFDKLVDSAKKRNRAFFDKLGLPTN